MALAFRLFGDLGRNVTLEMGKKEKK